MNYAFIFSLVKIFFLNNFVHTLSICENLIRYNSQENELINTFKNDIESFIQDEQ
jgi:hypothetical protein